MVNRLLLFSFLFLNFFNTRVYSQNWAQVADFGGVPRYVAAGFSIGDKGYIGIGWGGGYHTDFWEYEPEHDIWTQKADFEGTGRYVAVGFSILNKGYIGTGYDGTGFKDDFWEYDPAINSWKEKAPFPGGQRAVAVGFSIGSKGYVGTGWDGELRKDFWEYDPSSDTWVQKADFAGSARRYAVGFSIDSLGYLGTGNDSTIESTVLKDFWQYNPKTDSWMQKADFGGDARYVAVGFSIREKKGYIGTGWAGVIPNTYMSDFWEYDPSTDVWRQLADVAGAAREHAVGFSIGSNGYIGTGWDGVNVTNDFWKYTPFEVVYSHPSVYYGAIEITQPMHYISQDEPPDDSLLVSSVDKSLKKDVNIFPNPSRGEFKVAADGMKVISLQIMNAEGKNVMNVLGMFGESSVFVNAALLPKGIYFLKILTDSGIVDKRVVIE
jgi:N-acetylneuraminic acid mutarotase